MTFHGNIIDNEIQIFDLIRCDKITNNAYKYMSDKISMNLKNINSLSFNHEETEVNNRKRKAEEQIDKEKILKKNKD